MATDLSHWDFAESFAGYEVAALILGIEPTESSYEQCRISIVNNRIKSHYKNAIDRHSFEVIFKNCDFDSEFTPERQNKIELESVVMHNLQFNYWRYGIETPFEYWLSGDNNNYEDQEFSRFSIVNWLKAINMQSIYSFDLKNSKNDNETVGISNRWPWGNHHTEALGHLEAAANRWWKLYDPTDAATAPTVEVVSEWLQKEYKLSKKKADVMASILRPDGLPTGPRK